jgi:tRNA(Ile)-lysidine synthase
VRPLLPVRKSDILEFAKRQGITFREDSTNAHSICQRNFLRNELLPGLGKERREKLILDLVSLSESAKAAAALLEEKVSDAYRECLVSSRGGAVTLDLKKTRGYHYPVRTGMYRRAFGEVRHGTGELPRRASLLLFHLCEKGRSGMGIDLPGGVRAFRSFDVVTLTRETSGSGDTPSASLPIQPGTDAAFTLGQRTYRVRAWMRDTVDPSVIARAVHSSGGADEVYFDAGALDFPLFLRSWSEGDRISPFGLEGTKKLSDLLRESRVPREMRSSIPLLAESRRILWIVGLRRSSHAAVVPATRRVLEVKVMTESE